jgi:hypothetical protein
MKQPVSYMPAAGMRGLVTNVGEAGNEEGRRNLLVFLVIGGSAFSVTNIFCSQTQSAIRDWHHQFAPILSPVCKHACHHHSTTIHRHRHAHVLSTTKACPCDTAHHVYRATRCPVVMWNIGTLSQLVPYPQICGLSAFLRASSEPIAIVKAHAPQLPFRKVALFGTATIAHERLLFPATWIQPLDSTSSYKSTLPT